LASVVREVKPVASDDATIREQIIAECAKQPWAPHINVVVRGGVVSLSGVITDERARPMQMLNPHCGVDRDPRGVVRLTICNAGSLNILGSAVINGVREGLELLATEPPIRVLVIAGQSEKSMIGGADIKEMAKLDQASAEKFITGLRDLCEAVRAFPAPVIARIPGWCLGGGLEFAAACDIRIAAHDAKFAMPEVKANQRLTSVT
jgi:hypothetical protein